MRLAGPLYLPGCLAVNAWQILACSRFCAQLTPASARKFFLSTVFYPPVLFILLVLGK